MKNPYDDILNLPRPVSKTRPHMPSQDRAAQFAPFAALIGLDQTLAEAGRRTMAPIELGADALAELNQALGKLRNNLDAHPRIRVTYFVPDRKKSGGAYVTVSGQVKKFNEYEKYLLLGDGTRIMLQNIILLEQ